MCYNKNQPQINSANMKPKRKKIIAANYALIKKLSLEKQSKKKLYTEEVISPEILKQAKEAAETHDVVHVLQFIPGAFS